MFVGDLKGSFSVGSCCAQTKHRLARGIIIWFQKAPIALEQMQKSRRFSVQAPPVVPFGCGPIMHCSVTPHECLQAVA